MQITERLDIDNYVLGCVLVMSLVVIGMLSLVSHANEQEELGLSDIDQMGCGELKYFILNEKWEDYSARWTTIELHAKHVYTWMCEK